MKTKMIYAATAIIVATVLVLFISGSIGVTGLIDGETEEKIEIVDIDQTTTYESSLETAVLDERDDKNVVIEGQITGNTAGQTVYVDRIDVDDGNIDIYVDLEPAEEQAAMVITHYQYEIELSNIPADMDISIHHGEEVFELNKND